MNYAMGLTVRAEGLWTEQKKSPAELLLRKKSDKRNYIQASTIYVALSRDASDVSLHRSLQLLQA